MLRIFAFSGETATRLFDFYVESNEQNSHRSLRLILEYLVYSISRNPTAELGASVKAKLLQDAVTMVTRQSSKPSVKSAMSYLDYIIQKDLVPLSDVLETYREVHDIPRDSELTWDDFVAKLFDWMELQYVCSVAGTLLVTIFTSPWSKGSSTRFHPDSWQKFIYRALEANVELLEPIKLYVFIPLFRVDRPGALEYLQNMYSLQSLTTNQSTGWDLNSMIWLAMLEAGKKAGVVEEPGSGKRRITIPPYRY